MPSDFKNMVEEHDELEDKRRTILHEIQEFNNGATKYLIDHFPQALSISWSTLRRMARREVT